MLVLGYNETGGSRNPVFNAATPTSIRVHTPLRPPELAAVGHDDSHLTSIQERTNRDRTDPDFFYLVPSHEHSVAHGPGCTNGAHLAVGTMQSFQVHCYTSELEPCNPIAPGVTVNAKLLPGRIQPNAPKAPLPKVVDLNNGKFQINYTVFAPGPYDLDIG